jgi:hypothetical protein
VGRERDRKSGRRWSCSWREGVIESWNGGAKEKKNEKGRKMERKTRREKKMKREGKREMIYQPT